MQLSKLLFFTLAAGYMAAPSDRGSYTVSGLGRRKRAILKAGGNTLDIAIAMLETEHLSTNYIYGKFSKYICLCMSTGSSVWGPSQQSPL